MVAPQVLFIETGGRIRVLRGGTGDREDARIPRGGKELQRLVEPVIFIDHSGN